MVVCVECLPANKPWDVVSVTRRSSGVAPRACVRVYARVLVPPNLYIHIHTCTNSRLTKARSVVTETRLVDYQYQCPVSSSSYSNPVSGKLERALAYTWSVGLFLNPVSALTGVSHTEWVRATRPIH